MIFKRKLYDKMLEWKQQWKGRYAFLIKGARRVGKSTLVEEFAKREYKSYILIDFSKPSKQINELFEDMMDLDYFFMRLQTLMKVNLYKRESAIVFDEVQNQPLARQAIKHLVKDGRYDYIETRSLISIRKNVQNIVIPSEEMSMTLYPMDWEEFYWATGNEVSPDQIRQVFAMHRPMGQAVHLRWMRDLRLYMLVGGMPQAVDAYLHYNRGNAYVRCIEFQHAVEDYTQAIQLDPHLAEAYYNRGLVRLALKQQGEAISDLSKAGELGLYTAYSIIKKLRK